MEHEFSVDSVVEGVPVSAVSLHEAVREYREKCINIPDITRQLEESQANSGAWIGCVVGVYVCFYEGACLSDRWEKGHLLIMFHVARLCPRYSPQTR